MDQHESFQDLLTRLNNVRDSMEEALEDIRGIEDDYRRGLLEAHIKGALREMNEQITELVSQRRKIVEDQDEAQRPLAAENRSTNVPRGNVPQAQIRAERHSVGRVAGRATLGGAGVALPGWRNV